MIAPQTWVMDRREGKSRLIGAKKKGKVHVTEIFECDVEANKKAAAACPVNIIQVTGD
jgi:ferredoxin